MRPATSITGGSTPSIGEVTGEASRVDRRRGDDDGEVAALRQQLTEVAEDEVDVEAAFVRLVDDDGVVPQQSSVALDLGEEDPVRHQTHERVGADAVVEAHRVAHRLADRRTELAGKALGDRAGGHAARLCVADQPCDAAPRLEAQLGQLRALARAGLAGHDDHLVVAQGGDELGAPGADGQLRGIRETAGHERVADRLTASGSGAAVHAASLARPSAPRFEASARETSASAP